jgi:hypothetical protein
VIPALDSSDTRYPFASSQGAENSKNSGASTSDQFQTAYQLFYKARLAEIREEMEQKRLEVGQGGIVRFISAKWRGLSDTERAPFEEQAKVAREARAARQLEKDAAFLQEQEERRVRNDTSVLHSSGPDSASASTAAAAAGSTTTTTTTTSSSSSNSMMRIPLALPTSSTTTANITHATATATSMENDSNKDNVGSNAAAATAAGMYDGSAAIRAAQVLLERGITDSSASSLSVFSLEDGV